MRRLSGCVVLLIAALILVPTRSQAQESTSQRKLVNHAAPEYPALARSLKLSGVVRVEVLVAPDGSVKAADLRGGHPLLAQAALNAVRRWRWEPGAHESHEIVEVKFTP
jgi:TonB family protein